VTKSWWRRRAVSFHSTGVPRDPRAYFAATYVETGIVKPGDVAKGGHCMTRGTFATRSTVAAPISASRTLDVYYIHNPETQLGEVSRAEFMTRMRAAFQRARGGGRGGEHRAVWDRDLDRLSRGSKRSRLPLAVRSRRGRSGRRRRRTPLKVIQLPYNLGMTEAFTRANQRVKDRVVPVLEAAREHAIAVVASASSTRDSSRGCRR